MDDAGGGRADVLTLSADLPTRALAVGDELFGPDDDETSAVAVLVDGRLRVELDGHLLSEITIPGAFVGEIGALLGGDRTATVTAATPSTVRIIGDPEGFFTTSPALGLELSRQLAGRLQRLLAYLSDARAQYGDSDGHLSVFDSVLGRLASRPAVDIEPGSERDGDYLG